MINIETSHISRADVSPVNTKKSCIHWTGNILTCNDKFINDDKWYLDRVISCDEKLKHCKF